MGTNRRTSPFLEVESYKHNAAKKVLFMWLTASGFNCSMEQFYGESPMCFRPDISVNKDDVIEFWEVTHKNPVTGYKLAKMQYFSYRNNIKVVCHEISAEWILNQVGTPSKLKKFSFEICCTTY